MQLACDSTRLTQMQTVEERITPVHASTTSGKSLRRGFVKLGGESVFSPRLARLVDGDIHFSLYPAHHVTASVADCQQPNGRSYFDLLVS